MFQSRLLTLLLALAAPAAASAAGGKVVEPEPADLVLRGGRIVTLEPSLAEATALAARGGRIVALGGDADVAALVGPSTRVIELGGRLAVPGLIDAHAHFESLGRASRILKLAPHRTWDAIVAEVAAAAAKARPGEWILGRGWHQEKWDAPPAPAVEGFPVHDALSAATPDNPVLLGHASGHASIVNARAMALAGIGRATLDPAGGQILRDASGEPTGLLRETAEDLVEKAYAAALTVRPAVEVEAERRRDLEAAAAEALSKGITTLHDAGTLLEDLDLVHGMAADGGLGLRLWVMIRDQPAKLLAADLDRLRRIDPAGFFTVRALKLVGDGALGSRGAWLLEPYADLPGHTGLAVTEPSVTGQIAELAIAHGFQLAVHAIGDRANRETLDVYEATFRAHPEKRDLRWRIEHAQHLHPDEVPRFAKLGVIASMQGIHCTSDAPWVLVRLGERRAESGAYVWRKLLDAGATIANGTDAPVEDVDPLASFYASVSRRLADGSRFYPAQRMSRMEALASYTRNAAFAGFEEGEKGSLAVGKLADVVVLSKDILAIAEEEIPSARVDYTIVGGRVAYASSN